MRTKIAFLVVTLLLLPGYLWAAEIYRDGDKSLSVGWWGQAWYQWVEDGKVKANGSHKDLNDFLFRRSYFYVKGTATPWFSFFAHLAGDRYGQDGIVATGSNSGKGLGSGVALRDGWVNLKLMDEMAMLQIGRMYVPFTRNYGTTSTKAMLTTDLDWTQGGVRGSIFYPQNVGRDDGVTLWGNLMDGMIQYRAMAGDGNSSDDDDLRYAGRLSLSLWDPEKSWFNQGTYLGKKKVLSFGLGGDTQKDIVTDSRGRVTDYNAWTVDGHLDLPLGGGGCVSAEAAYIDISHSANAISATGVGSGEDAEIWSLKGGYLFPGSVGPGQLMLVAHVEYVDVDEPTRSPINGKRNDDTMIWGGGVNYYVVGHGNKISLDVTNLTQDEEIKGTSEVDSTIVTIQFAAGF